MIFIRQVIITHHAAAVAKVSGFVFFFIFIRCVAAEIFLKSRRYTATYFSYQRRNKFWIHLLLTTTTFKYIKGTLTNKHTCTLFAINQTLVFSLSFPSVSYVITETLHVTVNVLFVIYVRVVPTCNRTD